MPQLSFAARLEDLEILELWVSSCHGACHAIARIHGGLRRNPEPRTSMHWIAESFRRDLAAVRVKSVRRLGDAVQVILADRRVNFTPLGL